MAVECTVLGAVMWDENLTKICVISRLMVRVFSPFSCSHSSSTVQGEGRVVSAGIHVCPPNALEEQQPATFELITTCVYWLNTCVTPFLKNSIWKKTTPSERCCKIYDNFKPCFQAEVGASEMVWGHHYVMAIRKCTYLFKLVHLLVSFFEIEVVFEFYECLSI